MQKLINGIAIASGIVSLTVVGIGGYVFIRKDAIIDSVKSKITEAALGSVTGSLPDMMPDATGPALPVAPFQEVIMKLDIKWISIGVVGSLFAVSHLGMIGYIASRKTESKLPKLDIPVTPYTSYVVQADKEGYKLSYTANDPKTAYIAKDFKEKGGFLGLANNTQKVVEEYFMDGQINQGGPVSNHRSWIDMPPGLTGAQTDAITSARKSEACIKAIGSAEGTGRLVGTSIAAAAAPSLSSIPFVGWVAAGWVAMFGGNQGADIGGGMAEDMSKDC